MNEGITEGTKENGTSSLTPIQLADSNALIHKQSLISLFILGVNLRHENNRRL
jgi:hypothetical protein